MTKIIVIGSGVIGLSSALLLSYAGFRVSVITRNPEEATSWVAGGMLAPFSEGLEGLLFDFSYESLKEYPSFVSFLRDVSKQRVDLWMEGINRVVLKGEDELFSKARTYAEKGYKVELLEPSNALSKDVQGIIHYAEEGWVDAQMLMDALLFAVSRMGMEFTIDDIVRAHMKEERVVYLEGLKGKYEADFYLFCTGAWTKRLFDLPVFPVKGQALKVRDIYVSRVHYSSVSYIIPRSRYTYIGATSETDGFNPDTTLEGLKSLSENALRIIPSMKHACLISTLVGFRPASPDCMPIFKVGENYLVLTGHYRNGILHAPITAKLVESYLVRGEKSPYMDVFSANRFKNP